MCGIYLSNIPCSSKVIQEKLKKIKQRGPDNLGVFQKGNISLGHLRLSILDLDNRSNQPFLFDHLALVYNGELYNFKEIRKNLVELGYTFDTSSDTEVLLKGYHAWGEKILDRINGMFAFAIYDEKKDQVFVARDRLGVKPLYYRWTDGMLELCSQLGPLETNGELDVRAINSYLKTGYIPSPLSIYTDIKKLPPGTFSVFDLAKKTNTITTYWDLEKVTPRNIPYQQAKDELKELLEDAVKIRLQADVPYGCFLSGGIDSALVSSLASKTLKEPLNTFTIGFENKDFDESQVAQQFSGILKTKHRTTFCTEKELLNLLQNFFKVYDEPFSDSSAIPSLLLNKVTKPHATVVLSGDGGDESFLGYNHFEWIKKFSVLFYIPYIIRYPLSYLLPFSWIGKRGDSIKNIFRMREMIDFIQGIFYGFDTILIEDDIEEDGYEKYLYLTQNPFQKAADLNIKLWLENDSNVKVDRASMAYSVEVRSPFLDYRIVEFARKLPIDFRFHGWKRKRILRDILADYIPEKIFDQPKKGFAIPLAQWIRKDLKEEISSYMTQERLSKIPNLDLDKISNMFHLHMTKNIDYSIYIWRVYVLSKWINLKNLK